MATMTPFQATMQQRVYETSGERTKIVPQKDYSGQDIVLVQEPDEKGNWCKEFTTPPFKVAFQPELSGEGNLGDKFAPTPDKAKFRVVLVAGDLEGLFHDEADVAVALKAQQDWIEGVVGLSDKVFVEMLKHKNILKKQSADVLDMYSKMRKCKKNEVIIDDEVAESWCGKALSVPINTTKTPVLITAKAKVYKKNWKDKAAEPTIAPVPIYDRRGVKHMNKDDNSVDYVNRGDYVSLRVRFSTYVTPMGAYGTKFDLLGVTKLKGGKKRARGQGETIGSLDIFADSDDEE